MNLIYVGKIDYDENLIQLICKNYESRVVESPTYDTENLQLNITIKEEKRLSKL